jgi:hypothetical protein
MKWHPYTFTGTSGEKILLRVMEVSGDLQPYLELRRPDGTTLCFASSSGDISSECTADATGTHTLWVRSQGGTQSGDFKVHVIVTSSPTTETATAMAYGDIATKTAAEMHWYPFTFSGTSGEKLLITARQTSGTYAPVLTLRKPDGTNLCSNGSLATSFTMECTLNATGTHTLWVGGYYLWHNGEFKVHIARVSSPTSETATTIAYGDMLTATGADMRWHPFHVQW